MKTLISALAIAGLFSMSACNHDEVKQKEAALEAQQHTIDSMNAELAKKHVIDSMNEVTKTQYVLNPPVNTTTQVVPVAPAAISHRTVHHSSASHSRNNSSTASSTSSSTQSTQPVVYQDAPAEPAKKKGWSAKAKGALIGAGTGAAAGAIINGRNRGAGAIIGGVLGAAAGTGTGAIIDKKNGR